MANATLMVLDRIHKMHKMGSQTLAIKKIVYHPLRWRNPASPGNTVLRRAGGEKARERKMTLSRLPLKKTNVSRIYHRAGATQGSQLGNYNVPAL
jgi:hypothetical protein